MVEIFCFAEELYKMLNLAYPLVDKVVLNVGEGELSINVMDGMKTVGLSAKIPANVYENSQKGHSVGLGINRLMKILKGMRGEVNIVITGNEFKLKTQEGLTYKTQILDPKTIYNTFKLPKLDFAVKIKTTGKIIKDGIKYGRSISDRVYFQSDKSGEVKLVVKGDVAELIYTINGDIEEFEQNQTVIVGMEHLEQIIEPISNTDSILLAFKTDSPVMLGLTGSVKAAYFIAPVIPD